MHSPIVETLLQIIHVIVALFLVLVVLLQQGKGGGLGAAFGGGATAQVFGGRGAGNLLTRATFISAGIFMLTSVSLAYISSSGDRALRDRARADEATKKAKVLSTDTKAADPAKAATSAAMPETPVPADKPVEAPVVPAETPVSKPVETPVAPAPKPVEKPVVPVAPIERGAAPAPVKPRVVPAPADKPAETKPVESKPAESKPAETP